MRKILGVGVLGAAMLVAGMFISNYAGATLAQCLNNPPSGINNGKPFLEIWAAICELEDDIDNITPQATTITYTITSADTAGSVVIGPVTAKTFVMMFTTDGLYDGDARFQAKLIGGTWANIGPGQQASSTRIGGPDSVPDNTYELPLKIRVVVNAQATTGQSEARIDFL